MKTNIKKTDTGIALLFTLILVAIFFVLGMAFMSRANFSASMSRNLQESEESRLAANLALENIRTSFVSSFSSHHEPAIRDYGYSYPIYEARRLDQTGSLLTTVYGGSYNNYQGVNFSFEDFWDDEKGLRSLQGVNETNNEENAESYFQARYNQFGDVVTSHHWIYFNNVIDPSWVPSNTEPNRKGFRYGYFLIDKTGLIDINASKQRTGLSGNPDDGVSFTNNQVSGTDTWYSEFDLSKVWTSCTHEPSTTPLYNFDELYGREDNGTTIKSRPVGLEDLSKGNGEYMGAPRSTQWWDAYADTGSYSYKHITTPYSVTETFPAYTGTTYATSNGNKPHTRLALSTSTTFAEILSLPFFSRWGNNGATPGGAGGALTATEATQTGYLKNQVCANIKDYLDSDINTTTNYVSGATINSAIYCGTERVPYLNELTFTLNNDTNEEPLLYMKAELVWMYGATVATELGATKNDYSVKVIGTVEYTKVPHATGTAAASSTTNNFSFDLKAKDSITGDGYFVTQVARYSLDSNTADSDETSHGFSTISNATSFKADDVTVTVTALELYVGGQLVDIASLPSSTQKTGVSLPSTHTYNLECNDPRNNTQSSEWSRPSAANWMSHAYWQERWKHRTFPSWVNEGSFGRPNQTFATKYDSSDTALSEPLYPAYPLCDMETASSNNYIDYNGTVDTGSQNAIDPTTISTRYMPISGGITHEVELGMISRGKAWQTLNLTEYNLSDITKNHYNGSAQKSQYTAQYARTFIDDQRGISFHNPVGNVNTADNSDMPTCDGGDRQLLDDVYITSAGTLNDLSKEKIVYGKFNPNSVRLSAIKMILQTFNIPGSGDEVPNSETTVLKDDNTTSNRHASAIADRLNDVNLVHFMTKYTYDKTLPITATNSPNDPMRWGSKRLGTLFSLRSTANPDIADEAYFKREVGEATITDRQKETLLLKLKDFSSVRYSYYSGIIMAESMLYSKNNITGFNKVTDEIVAYENQVARPELYGQTLSQRQYRIELAYDHFLDKIVVLDYKYMGKLN